MGRDARALEMHATIITFEETSATPRARALAYARTYARAAIMSRGQAARRRRHGPRCAHTTRLRPRHRRLGRQF